MASEFTSPPTMSGTADNDVQSGDDLTYSFTLGSCTLSEKAMYGGDVTCPAYRYAAGSETIAEEDEEIQIGDAHWSRLKGVNLVPQIFSQAASEGKRDSTLPFWWTTQNQGRPTSP